LVELAIPTHNRGNELRRRLVPMNDDVVVHEHGRRIGPDRIADPELRGAHGSAAAAAPPVTGMEAQRGHMNEIPSGAPPGSLLAEALQLVPELPRRISDGKRVALCEPSHVHQLASLWSTVRVRRQILEVCHEYFPSCRSSKIARVPTPG